MGGDYYIILDLNELGDGFAHAFPNSDSAILFLKQEVKRLRKEVAECRQTIEDIACGTRLDCPRCGKLMPCLCEMSEEKE